MISGSLPQEFAEALQDNFFNKEKPPIYKIALIGPPSSGKTEFLKTLLKKCSITYKTPTSTTQILGKFYIFSYIIQMVLIFL